MEETKSEFKLETKNENEPDTKKLKLSDIEVNEPSTSTKEKDKCKTLKNNKDDDDDEDMCTTHKIPEIGFKYPLEMDSSDMLEEMEYEGYFPTVTERYLTPYYQLDAQKPGDDICILIHSNRVCMITLAPSHPILHENKIIENCNYKVSEKLDRTKNKVSGKSKHGAQPLQSNSNLCCLTCTDGSSYMIKCCMIGKLVEVNDKLVQNPELLKKEPHFGGYIAIVLPNLKHLDALKEKLLTQKLYEEAIRKRNEKKEQEKNEIVNIAIVDEKDKVTEQVADLRSADKEDEHKNEQVVNVKKEEEKEQSTEMETVEKEKVQDNEQCSGEKNGESGTEKVDSMEIVES